MNILSSFTHPHFVHYPRDLQRTNKRFSKSLTLFFTKQESGHFTSNFFGFPKKLYAFISTQYMIQCNCCTKGWFCMNSWFIWTPSFLWVCLMLVRISRICCGWMNAKGQHETRQHDHLNISMHTNNPSRRSVENHCFSDVWSVIEGKIFQNEYSW